LRAGHPSGTTGAAEAAVALEDEEPPAEEEVPDEVLDDEAFEIQVGARLGLVLLAVVGFVLGGLTCFGLWFFYPTGHQAAHWPVPTIGVGSALLLTGLYVTLARRLDPRVADALAVGYVLALLVFAGLLVSGEAIGLVRDRVEDLLVP
jgi:VIT1/CCC1 family predicted Fe2+/Mn2+ transporter